MVRVNRIVGKTEKQPFVIGWMLRRELYMLACGNRCGCECRVDGEWLGVAHNGVRGDDVVVVREARNNEITNSDEGGRHHVRTQSYGPVFMGAGVADRRPVGVRPSAGSSSSSGSGRDGDGGGAAGYVREESGRAVALEDPGV